ncbi:ATP-binding domain-containing protein [Flavonifractor plautii]|uniref:ATP-binding domain-containing protein n=1 Tax=Flavonifractor plautii TaxID=292800 RepID=UPI00210B07FF|nr:helicase C-terminal domain-containing protein [Flavonifractor plautii]
MIQSKGTSTPQISLDGAVHYRLRDLAFPAYVALEVTLDPGILFLVLNTGKRGQERVFWKYISPRFLASLDFSKDSAVIRFTGGDEIKNAGRDLQRPLLGLSVVPFQLAYTVSIHKAQGLEYNSAKEVIPSSNSEQISHGIFYTAITRAKEKLKIF